MTPEPAPEHNPSRATHRMKTTTLQSAINRYLIRHAGADRPGVYDVAASFPHLLELDRNYPAIREEMELVLHRRHDLPRYDQIDARQTNLSAEDARGHAWKVFPLYLMGRKPEANRALCPRTTALIDDVPDLFQAMFSILEPRKSIPAHKGPYLGYLRYHLGLRVPTDRPPRLRIKDTEFAWQEGRGIVIDDSWEHEVINDSDEIRVILMVDFLRPLPRVPAAVNRFVCRRVISRVYAREVARKVADFR